MTASVHAHLYIDIADRAPARQILPLVVALAQGRAPALFAELPSSPLLPGHRLLPARLLPPAPSTRRRERCRPSHVLSSFDKNVAWVLFARTVPSGSAFQAGQ
jgi:hypothetical protein